MPESHPMNKPLTDPGCPAGGLPEIQLMADKIRAKINDPKTQWPEAKPLDHDMAMLQQEESVPFHHNTSIYQVCLKAGVQVDEIILKLIQNWSAYYKHSHPLNLVKQFRTEQPVVDLQIQKCLVDVEDRINSIMTSEETTDELNRTDPSCDIKGFVEGLRLLHIKMELLTKMFLQFFDEKAAAELGLEFEVPPKIDVSLEYDVLTDDVFATLANSVQGNENCMFLVNDDDWENFENKPGDGLMLGYAMHVSKDHAKGTLIFREYDGQE